MRLFLLKKCHLVVAALFMLLCMQQTNAQVSVHTLTTPNNNDTKIATQRVELRPGFKTYPALNQRFNAYIDKGVRDQINYETPVSSSSTSGTYLPLGATKVLSTVSATGAATCQIPVFVSPGTAGVQPAISLVYNSQSSSGIAGIGWSILGSSSISRIPTTWIDDKKSGAIDFNQNIFALDGQRLFTLDESAYSPYGTVIQSYSTITKIGDDPTGFKAVTKTGAVMEYGLTDDSRIRLKKQQSFGSSSVTTSKPFSWLLNRTTDANGNFMTYRYQEINNQTVLAQIDYTGNEQLPYNSVIFEYAKKQDSRMSYFEGWPMYDNLLLSEIKVICEGTVVRRYTCMYSIINGRSSLNQVVEYGSDGNAIGNTIIEWGQSHEMTSTQIAIPEAGTSWDNINEKEWSAADIDGDGAAELISANKSTLGSFGGFQQLTFFKQQPDNSFKKVDDLIYNFALKSSGISKVRRSGRIFDGTTKYFTPDYWSNDNDSYVKFEYRDINEKTAGYYEHKLSKRLDDDPTIEPIWTLADINNDGIDEIIYVDGKYASTASYYRTPINILYPKTGSTCDVASFYFSSTQAEKFVAGAIIVADFNTDGQNDIMIIHDKGYYIYLNGFSGTGLDPVDYKTNFSGVLTSTLFNSSYSFIKLGDFNGDGAVDLLVNEQNTSNWKLLVNDGTGSFAAITVGSATSGITMQEESFTGLNDCHDNCIVTDFNNDGKSDVIIIDYTYHRDYNALGQENGGIFDEAAIQWFKSNGIGFENVKTIRSTDQGYSSTRGIVIADFNGDGREDIVNFGGYLTKLQSTPGFTFTTNFNNEFNDGLVTKVSNSSKNFVNFYYQPLTLFKHQSSLMNTPFYVYAKKTTSNTYPVISICAPFYCVRTTMQPDANGNNSYIDYAYLNAQIHTQGRGFLGFQGVQTYNYAANKKTYSTMEYDKANRYLLQSGSTLINTLDNVLISSTFNSFTNSSIGRGRYKSNLTNITEYDFSNIQRTTTNTFDNNGNIIKSVVDFGLECSQTTESTGYVAVGTSTYPCLATSVTTSRKHPDDDVSFSIKTDYTFDTKGNLKTQVCNGVTTTYSDFTSHGIPRKIVTSATSEGNDFTKTLTKTFDKYSRFVLSENDVNANVTTTYLYDSKYGNKLQSTALGLTSKYEYDPSRGLPTKVTDVRGNAVVTSYELDPTTGGYIITETPSYGYPTKKYFDAYGKSIKILTKDYIGTDLVSSVTYYSGGSVSKEESTFGGVVVSSKSYTYDPLSGKPASENNLRTGATVKYEYSKNSLKKTINNKLTTTDYDGWGNPIKITDPTNNDITYKYYSNGKTKSISSKGYYSQMVYDSYGNQTGLDDSDAGKSTYRYDVLGRLTYQKLPSGDETRLYYDNQGRLSYKKHIATGDQYEYYEYVTTNNGFGKVKSVTNKKSGAKEEYEYDTYGQLTKHTKTIDATISPLVFQYQYDNYGHDIGITYPDGKKIDRMFTNGRLTEIKYGNTSVWKLKAATTTQKIYEQIGSQGELYITTKTFDATNGTLKSIVTVAGTDKKIIQNESYLFEAKTGLLQWRQDNRNSNNIQREDFAYNDLEQLTSVKYYKNGVCLNTTSVNYSSTNNGNIESKTGVGIYRYDQSNHAITGLENSPVHFTNDKVSYNYLNLPETIVDLESPQSDPVTFFYDPLGIKNKCTQRSYTTQYYDGLYYREQIPDHYIERDYIKADEGVVSVLYSDFSLPVVFLSDYLGSIIGPQGVSCSYDAWGNVRNADDWLSSSHYWVGIPLGYIGQESINGYIHLNARLYDPVLGMFLAPDNYMQAPGFRPNHNRYAYCFGNPLKYTDPSGNVVLVDDICAALIGGVLNWAMNGCELSWRGLGFFGVGAAAGWTALYGPAGWAASGAILSGGNTALIGGSAQQIVENGIAGVASGIVGGVAGPLAGKLMAPLTSRINSIMLQTIVNFGVQSSVGGYAGGFTYGLMSTGDISYANQCGLFSMAISGGIGVAHGVFEGYRLDHIDLSKNVVQPNTDQTLPISQPETPQLKLPNGGRSQMQQMPEDILITVEEAPTSIPFNAESPGGQLDGSFCVLDWTGYPNNGIKPSGPFRILDGAEYTSARNLANSTNLSLRRANPDYFDGLQIHEIHPIKFGGSPTELSNKIFINRSQHIEYTNYWNSLMRSIK